ncbi:winged helix-turn-helix domain-containing protein [Microbacterium aurantiacum]|uniref:Winged helix-turn-helix domain-containing protein n=1 Tax=Microbacterium aurantiacum TaxID=162393 RepID=A0ABT8FUL6_9MICO|nr:winged helix-turn-helix domain-containing protein [Microbacterium aurantiacum]MDN4465011.1 winged helix-turn-helix domain-containing protein [Microbacterium aurantiacum]
MSNTALLERPAAPVRRLHPVNRPTVPAEASAETASAPTPAASGDTGASGSAGAPGSAAARSLPPGTAPRGFALYVGIDEAKASAAGVNLGVLVDALRRTLADLAPSAETYATVALAPVGAGGRDVDVVRLALHEPSAVARTKQDEPLEEDAVAGGVVVDISRKRVLIDGESAAFTFKEFELLQYLVLREGRTIERTELVTSLWQAASDEEAPGERTIDVHVRRLRAKLGRYEDIVRTVRGVGYRFDRHADVVIHYGHGTPSPDRF